MTNCNHRGPLCSPHSPVCGKLRSVSPQTLADTQWPWHVAIYRHIPRSDGANAGRTESEEGSFGGGRSEGKPGWRWQLTCSGTLVNQYSVVVAAHCVTEPGTAQYVRPADIKVAMGKRHLNVQINSESSDLLRVCVCVSRGGGHNPKANHRHNWLFFLQRKELKCSRKHCTLA